MGDIAALGDPTYLLVPLDEKPFTIDANTRTITVPSDFSKCGAVRSDNLCEIATFKIARYYDFQDLADCEIGIQWINADGQEGLSMAFGIDVESDPGYIRFGWAITEAVTAKAGNVKLAVRFFKKDKDNKLKYLLNTLSTTITVKDTLSVDDSAEDFVEETNVIDLFKDFVSNSQNPMYATPAQPVFAPGSGGINFEQNAQRAIEEDNTLDLSVMAVTKDNSHLEYEWFYAPSDVDDTVINLTKNISDLAGIGHEVSAYEIDDQDYALVDPIPESRGIVQYYIDNSGNKEPYSGEWDPEALAGKLYIKRSTLKFLDGDYVVTGEYWAKATSSLIEVNDEWQNPNTSEAESNKVSILPPNDIVVKEDLPNHIFLGNDLQFVLEEDPRDPAVTYEWYQKTTKEGVFSKINEVADSGYSPAAAGWYQAKAYAKLNRTSLDEISNICFVTEEAITPSVSKYEYSIDQGKSWVELESENTVIDLGKDGSGKHEIWVKLTVDESKLTEFNSDKDNLTYAWRISYGDRGIVENVTEDLIAKNGTVLNTTEYGTNVLKVFQDQDSDIFDIYCSITNNFQGQSKTIDTFDLNRPFSIA